MFTQRLDVLSNFHANIIQLQNTFKGGFFADIARRGVFTVQFVDSFVQKSGVTRCVKFLALGIPFLLWDGCNTNLSGIPRAREASVDLTASFLNVSSIIKIEGVP